MLKGKRFFDSKFKNFIYRFSEGCVNRRISSKYHDVQSFYELDRVQQEKNSRAKLVKTLHYSAKKVPYYRDLFRKHNISIDKIESDINYFQEIPLLTKEDIFNNFERLISDDCRQEKLIFRKTNGSTGKSLSIVYSQDDLDWTAATNLYTYRYSSRGISDLEGHIELTIPTSNFQDQWCDLLRNKALYRRNIKISNLSEESLKEIVRYLEENPLKVVQGYPSTFTAIANYLKTKNLKLARKIPYFVCTGESLSEGCLNLMREVLCENVLNRYGLAEFGAVAHSQVNSVKLDFFPHSIFKETSLDPVSQNKELVLTSLYRKAMPLIRYRTGDLVAEKLDNDSTGVTVIGRTHEVVNFNNTETPTYFFQDAILQDDQIKDFQIITGPGKTVKRLEILTYAPFEKRDDIEKRIHAIFDQVPVSFSEGLTFAAEDKKSYVISEDAP